MNQYFTFTSESVSEGHPDKICDQISDGILDAFLEADPKARVAVETAVTTNRVVLLGETRGPAHIDHDTMEHIARETVRKIGYDQEGFNWKELDVDVYVHDQSPDIAQGVDSDEEGHEGPGDQGIMFGYACNETDALMPAPIYYAHRLLQNLAHGRHNGDLPELGPDAKAQFSVVYENGQPIGASNIVVSTQHHKDVSLSRVKELVMPYIEDSLPKGWLPSKEHIFINPTGKFVIGGPHGDAGLTGRKITVDTYGGAVPHGGGAFSGKDASKVDRSATYAMRYLAKNIVAAGLADRCTLQVAYAIGKSEPLALYINSHRTNKVPEGDILAVLPKVMDLRPRGIRDHLRLDHPIYQRTAAYGHFGREPDADGGFSWEKTDLVGNLQSELNFKP